ncbi:MAG TPA: hypothetical protein VHB74_12120 [Devosia sp.]|nr:hypothetical protein [Devosia sp.]
MAEAQPLRRLLFISNGLGEDSIAAEIIRRLPAGLTVEAYPMLGQGLAFRNLCPVIGPRAQMASEGWRNVRFSLLRDLAGGALGTIAPSLAFLRGLRGRYDRIVVVGDMVGVIACFAAGLGGITYLDVYKTGFGRLYWPPESWLVGRTARTAFCRSDRLAAQLRAAGVDARAAGNVMMDTVTRGQYDAAARRTRASAVTLLPGSRQFTAESFSLQVAALRRLSPEARPDIFLAAAGSIALDEIAAAAGLHLLPPAGAEAGDAGTLTDGDLLIHAGRGVAGNLIDAADVVLSQAGTATVQALGLGKPVITFINPRDRQSRVRAENALFGEARLTVPPDAEIIAQRLAALLADPAQRARLGAIGRERIGPPGAIEAIVEALIA